MYQFQVKHKRLKYKIPAKTSRGVYTHRDVYYIIAKDNSNGRYAFGEVAPLPDLSIDYSLDLEDIIKKEIEIYGQTQIIDKERLKKYPSILFALESIERQMIFGSNLLFETDFTKKISPININGLVWMADFDNMKNQIDVKIKLGFKCIKLKIGAINFEEELKLLEYIRKVSQDIEIRVDANGAFSPEEAIEKLEKLSEYNIHSIEQPIKAGQWQEMAKISRLSKIPVALDEELIKVIDLVEKKELLDTIKPSYIILKPSLHGSFYGANEWIKLAKERNISYWATSALETNIGLNAIAQWASSIDVSIAQGLGTGQLFETNIDAPLSLEGDKMYFIDLPKVENQIEWILND